MEHLFILGSKTTMNPIAPQDNMFFEKDQVCYIIQLETSSPIAVTSFGSLDLSVGDSICCTADQSRRFMGYGNVLGIVTFETMKAEGCVPSRKLRHYVVK